jgi:hypothetical protein
MTDRLSWHGLWERKGVQKTVPYLKQLVAGFQPLRPGFASDQNVEFVVDKAALGQIVAEYFGFPCQLFHQILHHYDHPGLAK